VADPNVSDPGPRPVAPAHRDGDSCPVCGKAVERVRHYAHERGATLLPCGHKVGVVRPPGDRVGFP
jgi:hypothetical protein